MAESAALLVDEVLPETPMRQWVLSFQLPLRFLFASRPEIMGRVLGIIYRVLSTHLIRKAGYTASKADTGAVTLIQRFGGTLNLNVHLMCMDARMPLLACADLLQDTSTGIPGLEFFPSLPHHE
jgi:hypothetical protein